MYPVHIISKIQPPTSSNKPQGLIFANEIIKPQKWYQNQKMAPVMVLMVFDQNHGGSRDSRGVPKK